MTPGDRVRFLPEFLVGRFDADKAKTIYATVVDTKGKVHIKLDEPFVTNETPEVDWYVHPNMVELI